MSENPHNVSREHDNTLIPVCPFCNSKNTTFGEKAEYKCNDCNMEFNEHKLIQSEVSK